MDRIKLIKDIIEKGEGIEVEFKESHSKLNKDVFETVCAFLNRNGGHLFLGVDDRGKITGLEDPRKIIAEFVSLANNPQKLKPTFYFFPEQLTVNRKEIVHIYIPSSSQVHKTNGRIFDRSNDGDFDITDNTELVSSLYLRKQKNYSENKIYPYAALSDLKSSLLNRVRNMIKDKAGEDSPLTGLSDMAMLQSLGLYQKDFITGNSGFTLAAILLFGKDETILSVLPHYRTDAILRRVNLDRYDDRDDIRINLIESYDRLMDFIKKHLPDPFYLEDDTRVSLRTKIFREAVVNILIHREFTNAYPAKMIIEADKVVFENANIPHGSGLIKPESFSPFPKNPKIARVFKEIGLADELGSGVRNLFKYSRIYSNKEPQLIEEDIFKIIVPYPSTEQATEHVTEYVTEHVTEHELLQFCEDPKSTSEIMEFLGLKHREHFRANILKPLLESGKLSMTIPDKPRSKKQKYFTAKK